MSNPQEEFEIAMEEVNKGFAETLKKMTPEQLDMIEELLIDCD